MVASVEIEIVMPMTLVALSSSELNNSHAGSNHARAWLISVTVSICVLFPIRSLLWLKCNLSVSHKLCAQARTIC